jgi:multifunctional methyltransferase subunit TRM112
LKIEATEVVLEESPMDQELLLRVLPKLDYTALVAAWQQVKPVLLAATTSANSTTSIDLWELPATLPDPIDSIRSPPATPSNNINTDADSNNGSNLISTLHRILFDVHVIEGELICPDTKRQFHIREGIPNMILHEDEL